MGITAITIENFKGIREPVRVELKPITLLFGPNSAGKSTIIQALHYAREIFERQNLNPDRTLLGGGAIDLGGFESLVHKHDTIFCYLQISGCRNSRSFCIQLSGNDSGQLEGQYHARQCRDRPDLRKQRDIINHGVGQRKCCSREYGLYGDHRGVLRAIRKRKFAIKMQERGQWVPNNDKKFRYRVFD